MCPPLHHLIHPKQKENMKEEDSKDRIMNENPSEPRYPMSNNPTENKECPHKDCPKVHYIECPIHGSGTHQHVFNSPCNFNPPTHTKEEGWEKEFDEMFYSFRQQELVEKIEEAAKLEPHTDWQRGYTKALSDILAIIKGEK